MTYTIIGAGLVGTTLARFFAAKDILVLIANSRGPETLAGVAAEIAPVPLAEECAVGHERRPFKWRLLDNFRYTPGSDRCCVAVQYVAKGQ